jgi:hypothetical protein
MAVWALCLENGSIREKIEAESMPRLAASKAAQWLPDPGPPALDPWQSAIATVPVQSLHDDPPPALAYTIVDRDLAEVKAECSAAVDAIYLAKIGAGVAYNGAVYQIGPDKSGRWGTDNIADMAARANLAIDGKATWPTGFAFIADDNTPVPMTAEQMLAFATAAQDYFIALRIVARAKKTAIANAPDGAAVYALDLETGWPANG